MDMGKIKSFKKVAELIKPHQATVIGSSFYPFNSYYFDLLKWSAKKSRPLIVIVQTDKIVSLRRGLVVPSENQNQRARQLALLPFVDYIIISSRVAHNPFCIKFLKPRFIIFQRDNKDYQREIFGNLKTNYPDIQVKIAPFKRNVYQRPCVIPSFHLKTKDRIVSALIFLAKNSEASFGKISAVLMKKNKIIAMAANSDKEEHAEIILFEKFKLEKDLSSYTLFTLIPPCLACAKVVADRKLRRVFYLFRYGDGMGIKCLKSKGIKIRQHRIKSVFSKKILTP
jgi:tRNA(Arg) A34 adenosine deaminase TadA